MTLKMAIFVLVQIQKVIFCNKADFFHVYWISQFEEHSTQCSELTANVREIEKAAMFESSVVLYGRLAVNGLIIIIIIIIIKKDRKKFLLLIVLIL